MIGLTGIVLLMFISSGYEDSNGNTYSIWELITSLNSMNSVINTGITGNKLLDQAAMGGMFRVFCVLCTGVGYTMMLSEERTSGFIRFSIFQTKTHRYVLAKFVSGTIYGGLMASVGFLLYVLFLSVILASQGVLVGIIKLSSDIVIVFIQYIGGVFLFGIFQNAFIFFFAAWIKNKYLLLSIPFFVEYLYLQFLYAYMNQLIDSMKLEHFNFFSNLNPYVLIYSFTQYGKIWIGGLWLLASLLPGAVYFWGMSRRLDKGE